MGGLGLYVCETRPRDPSGRAELPGGRPLLGRAVCKRAGLPERAGASSLLDELSFFIGTPETVRGGNGALHHCPADPR